MGPQYMDVDENLAPAMVEFFTVFFPMLLVYGLCIWQASKIALARGRSRRKWTFRAVLFGPLAILVLLLLPSRAQPYDRRSQRWR
jgi:hypothetical protein